MPAPLRARRPLLALLLLMLAGAALTLAVAASAPPARAAAEDDERRLRQLERRIDSAEARRDKRRGTERVLTRDIAAWTARIDRLQGRISGLQARQATIQADLDREQGELDRLQTELRAERARLLRLRARLTEAREILSARLLELYQTDRPDMVTVVMNSDGFADLVQRGEFLDRIGRQDREVVVRVRAARTDAQETTDRLERLEERQAATTGRIQARRDEVKRIADALVDTRAGYRSTRAGKTRALRRTRGTRRGIQSRLSDLRDEQEEIQEKLGIAVGAGPIKQGSGRFVWPLVGQLTSPWCERRSWENCHPGIDIARPTGTPIRAADSGTVTVAGPQGGYGNFTCISHGGKLSTCYGHQSSIGVRVGEQVTKGEVIGKVGSTGFSTGPHLHFEVRVNGSVRNPMSYL